MSKLRRNNQRKKSQWNRDVPDSILLVHSTAHALHRAESLCPSESTLDRFVSGVPEAQAIIAAYAPLPLPVTEVYL